MKMGGTLRPQRPLQGHGELQRPERLGRTSHRARHRLADMWHLRRLVYPEQPGPDSDSPGASPTMRPPQRSFELRPKLVRRPIAASRRARPGASTRRLSMAQGRDVSDWNVNRDGDQGVVACAEYAGRFKVKRSGVIQIIWLLMRGPARRTKTRSAAPLRRRSRRRSGRRADHRSKPKKWPGRRRGFSSWVPGRSATWGSALSLVATSGGGGLGHFAEQRGGSAAISKSIYVLWLSQN